MTPNPITKIDLANVRRGLAALGDCKERIEKLQAAGLELGEQEARCEHLRGVLAAILKEYGPGGK